METYDEMLAEVREMQLSLTGLIGVPETPETDNSVWSLYAKCERLVGIIKFRLDVERPGSFLELPRSEMPGVFLRPASEALEMADEALANERYADALEWLRTARTNLRAYLASKRRIRMRSTRKARPRRPSP